MTHFMYCARLNACVVGSNLTVKRGKSDKSVKTINKEKLKKRANQDIGVVVSEFVKEA